MIKKTIRKAEISALLFMLIYLVRHGETYWNNEGRIQGATDIELNDYGIELAKVTAEALKDVPFDICVTSDLKRAVKTTEILRGDRDIPIHKDVRLREMCFGSSEGDDLRLVYEDKNHPMHNFVMHPEIFKPLDDGESFEDVENRAREFIEDVLLPAERINIGTMLVSSHGAFIRCFLRCIRPMELEYFWSKCPQKNCSVNIIELKNGVFKVIEEGHLYYDTEKAHETVVPIL